MSRLQTLEIPIAKLQARHNCLEARKKKPQEANGLHYWLCVAKGDDVTLPSNLWTPVGLHNRARGKVLFFYMNSDGPRYQALPVAVVVQFCHLEPDMPDFLEDCPVITIPAGRENPSCNRVFTRTQFPLNLS